MPWRLFESPDYPGKRFLEIRFFDVDDPMFDSDMARDGPGGVQFWVVAGPPCRQRNAGSEAAPCCLHCNQGGVHAAAEQDGEIAVSGREGGRNRRQGRHPPDRPTTPGCCLPERGGTPASSTAFRRDLACSKSDKAGRHHLTDAPNQGVAENITIVDRLPEAFRIQYDSVEQWAESLDLRCPRPAGAGHAVEKRLVPEAVPGEHDFTGIAREDCQGKAASKTCEDRLAIAGKETSNQLGVARGVEIVEPPVEIASVRRLSMNPSSMTVCRSSSKKPRSSPRYEPAVASESTVEWL